MYISNWIMQLPISLSFFHVNLELVPFQEVISRDLQASRSIHIIQCNSFLWGYLNYKV
jgi:hypothetical protein